MNEPRCRICGQPKVAHTAKYMTCPDTYVEIVDNRPVVRVRGYLESTYTA